MYDVAVIVMASWLQMNYGDSGFGWSLDRLNFFLSVITLLGKIVELYCEKRPIGYNPV